MSTTGSNLIRRRASLDAVARGFRAVFREAIGSEPIHWKDLASYVASDSLEENYVHLDELPVMEKWEGDRKISQLAEDGWVIRNENFANGIEVHDNELRFDKLAIVTPRIRSLAKMADRKLDDLVGKLFGQGFSTVGPDGQYFFDTDHEGPSGSSQSNLGTAALATASYNTGRTALEQLKMRNGIRYGSQGTQLVVPSALRSTARALVELPLLSSGASNPDYGTAKLKVWPELDQYSTTAWYLIDDRDKDMLPMIVQIVGGVDFMSSNDQQSGRFFMRKTHMYGADMLANAGFGPWWKAYASTGLT